jgi:hypothetical protein
MVETSYTLRALHAIAGSLSDVGLHSIAANLFQYEWNHAPRSASLAIAIGNCRFRAGADAEAVVFFKEACRRETSSVEARAGMVCALFRQGLVREAGREAAALAALDPCAEMWVLVAELRKRVGDTIGSLDAFRQAAQAGSQKDRFLLGEAVLGETVWSDLVTPLDNLRASRKAVGVGTHLVRSRGTLLARVLSRRKKAAVLAAFVLVPGSTHAQTGASSGSEAPKASQVHPDVMKALPTAGSVTGRVVQTYAGLVLEREEGAGLFPSEPSRFAFRGGSWTHTRIEIDGFDVTDPIFGGRPLVWGSVDLGEVEVRTDGAGTLLSHLRKADEPSTGLRYLVLANAGLFDSSGSTSDPIPSLARGHHLYDGLFGLSGEFGGGSTLWSGALSGVDVVRSERDSDRERASARLGFEGRASHVDGDDRLQGLAMYQGTRGPFGSTSAETRAKGFVLGAEWSRRETQVRVSYLRGTSNDPVFTSPVPFERLVDGPPQLQVPWNAVGQRIQLGGRARLPGLPDTLHPSFKARFARATSSRELTQPLFQALESLDTVSARQWSFSGTEPMRVAENRLELVLSGWKQTSDRTRLSAAVELQRVTIGDRDGDQILGSTKVLPELRFDWTKNEHTNFFAEASIGTPPVPLVSFEAAARNAPIATARLWRDQNRDGLVSSPELGLEVARRSQALVSVDPNLSLPTMRRVMIGFNTKVRGILIHATAFARRDRDLIETALDPLGSEIARTRNLADPSGDIVGPTDDQILPIVEETLASFAASRLVLGNPAEHRALGEGAELGFATNGKNIHWGLNGAAFRVSGRGGHRGLRAAESDFGVVGESFDRTNADTYGYGRLFFDRAYSLKMFLTANNIKGFTFGALGRYDDGQPFARLVIQNDLPQGPDFVQAIARGRARLHYTLSVDAKLAKRFEVSGAKIEASLSVFNALGSKFEAEEQVVWRSDYRRITMVQPPRAFVIGLRIER